MAFDPLQKLAESGTPIDLLTDEQRAVLSSLSEYEVGVIASVQARLEAAGGEVEGQGVNFNFRKT